MAFNEFTAQRIREILFDKGVNFTEKKMFSSICFMVDDKMCCGTHIDKRTNEDLLLCRIGQDVYSEALKNPDCIPMNFTGKVMKGFVYVTEQGIRKNKQLVYWLQLCLNYNQMAKKSKK